MSDHIFWSLSELRPKEIANAGSHVDQVPHCDFFFSLLVWISGQKLTQFIIETELALSHQLSDSNFGKYFVN